MKSLIMILLFSGDVPHVTICTMSLVPLVERRTAAVLDFLVSAGAAQGAAGASAANVLLLLLVCSRPAVWLLLHQLQHF
jgi:hypothetical protein